MSSVTVAWADVDSSADNSYGVYLYDMTGAAAGYQTVVSEQAEFTGLQQGASYYIQVAQMDTQGQPLPDTLSDRLEVVTRPDISQTGIFQQGQTETSVNVFVSNMGGANQLAVYTGYPEVDINTAVPQVFTAPDITLQIPSNTAAHILVYPQRTSISGYIAVDRDAPLALDVYVAPAKVQEVYPGVWYPSAKPKGTKFPGYKSNKVILEWKNDFYSDGYSIVIYSLKGKKLKTYNAAPQTEEYCNRQFTLTAIKNKGFIAEVSAYKVIGGVKCYGTCSDRKFILPQATVAKVTGSVKKRTIYWKKVDKASKYIVYRVRNGKLKEIKTVGKKSRKYTVKNLKSGDGLAVAAKIKVNGQWYTSAITWYVSQY